MALKRRSTVIYFVVSIVCAIISTIATIKTQSIPGDVFIKVVWLFANKIVTIIGIACMIVAFLSLSGGYNKK